MLILFLFSEVDIVCQRMERTGQNMRTWKLLVARVFHWLARAVEGRTGKLYQVVRYDIT